MNANLEQIAVEPDWQPRLTPGDGSRPGIALVASGVAYANLVDLLAELGPAGSIDLYQVLMPYSRSIRSSSQTCGTATGRC